MSKYGLWLIGARGGVATTVIAGLAALSQKLVPNTGLITDHPEFSHCGLPEADHWLIGGHEIRQGQLVDSARSIEADSGSLSLSLIEMIQPEFQQADQRIRPGVLVNADDAIRNLDDFSESLSPRPAGSGTDRYHLYHLGHWTTHQSRAPLTYQRVNVQRLRERVTSTSLFNAKSDDALINSPLICRTCLDSDLIFAMAELS